MNFYASFISGWKTPFSFYFSSGALATNFLFCLSESILILPSFLEDAFVIYRIIGFNFSSFQHLKHVILLFYGPPLLMSVLKVVSLFFSGGLLRFFCLSMSFQHFDYDASNCGFLSSVCGLTCFIYFAHYLSNSFSMFNLSSSLRPYLHMHTILLNLICLLLFVFSLLSLLFLCFSLDIFYWIVFEYTLFCDVSNLMLNHSLSSSVQLFYFSILECSFHCFRHTHILWWIIYLFIL